jgi:hypothetical protein
VGLEADSYYSIYDVYTAENATVTTPAGISNYAGRSSALVHSDSETVNFSTLQEPELFPTALIFAVSATSAIILTSVGFVYVHKKRRLAVKGAQ